MNIRRIGKCVKLNNQSIQINKQIQIKEKLKRKTLYKFAVKSGQTLILTSRDNYFFILFIYPQTETRDFVMSTISQQEATREKKRIT